MSPTRQARTRLCHTTNLKMSASRPTWPVAAVATQMLWASIIFPITPPVEFDVAMRTGLSPRDCAVIFWRLPKRAFEAASVPVRKTPSHPRSAAKKG